MRFSTVKDWSNLGSFLLKAEKWKSISSGKRYQIVLLRTYLAVLRKQPEVFCPSFNKNHSGSEKEIEERKITRALPSTFWKHFGKHCWKICWSLELLNALSGKNPSSLGKKVWKWPLHTKNDECSFLSENFAQCKKVCRSKYKNNKLFRLERITTLFLCTRFLQFWDQCQNFWIKLVRSPIKMILLWGKNQLERLTKHLDFIFKKKAETFLVDAGIFTYFFG